MKLSFSIPSKSTPKLKPSKNEEESDVKVEEKQFVTEFVASETLANSGKSNRNSIIPPMENEWRPHKRMKNLDLPLSLKADTDIRFEVETLSSTDAGDGEKMSYGLNLRQRTTANTTMGDGNAYVNGTRSSETQDPLLEKFWYDLKRLPEDRGMEEFKDRPVEGFGAALLAGYGWHEGRGIGRNTKEDVKVKEYQKRTSKEGLGFGAQDSTITNLKKAKDKEKGKIRFKSGDGFFVDKDVRVIGGTKESLVGSKATIVERLDTDWVVLRLEKTEEEFVVRVIDIADLGSIEEEKCLKELKELRIRNVKKTKNGDNSETSVSRSRGCIKRDGRDEAKTGRTDRDRRPGVSWLKSHIRVRIISKDLKGGRLYLKKGEVVDVIGPYICDISMDEGRELVQGVDQDLLETALPRRGGPVLILLGKHQGKYGNLVQRDSDREIGVVQESETHELLNVKLEEIAEYIGDPSYIGY